MKNINFISPVPPAKKKEVRRWIILSSLLIGGLLLYISVELGTHLYLYYSLSLNITQQKSAAHHCAMLMQTHKEKESNYKQERERQVKLEQYKHHPKNPHSVLQAIIKILGPTAIQNSSITPHTIEFSYTSNSIEQAHKQFEGFKSIAELQNAQFVSLHRNNNVMVSTIQAHHHKKKSRV